MDKFIATGFANLCEHYKQSMKVFRACKPRGEVSEQNLVTAFLLGCLKEDSQAHWGVEVPFMGNRKTQLTSAGIKENNSTVTAKPILPRDWQNHIDAFIYSNGTLYLIEAKRDYPASTFLELIKADYYRLHSKELALSFHQMLNRPEIYSEPFGNIKKVKGVLLADTWSKTNLDLWKDGYYKPRGQKEAYELSWLESMKRDQTPLGFKSRTASESYSLLVAHTDDLERSREIINNGL